MAKITKIEQTTPTIAARKRVAAYARVSMETERLNHSLSAQISYYSSLIQKNPKWEYVGVYADSFVTGTSTKHRMEFQRLVRDCENGKIDIVLCKSISRFARNTVDLLETVRHLKDIGVEVRFEKEHINSMSGDGELMLSILASFAQEESRSISDNCKWGIRKGFQTGKLRATKIFGYRAVNGIYTIELTEAQTVYRIFELFLSGMSFYKIAEKLNKEGVKSLTGKPFSGNIIGQIIRNEKYTGNSLLQKYYVKDGEFGKTSKNYGELPMYYAQETHPAIISQEMFNSAQAEIAQRFGVRIENGIAQKASWLYQKGQDENSIPFKSSVKMKYLHYDLSSFIKCEVCGATLDAKNRVYADGTPVLYWECHKHNKRIAEKGIDNNVPRPIVMKDEKLKELIANTLEIEKFDVNVMAEKLLYISLLGDMLTFHFKDGQVKKEKYIKGKRRYIRSGK